jgi:hypothetical protein
MSSLIALTSALLVASAIAYSPEVNKLDIFIINIL